MRASRVLAAVVLGLCLLSAAPLAKAGPPQAPLPTPEQFLGFRVGADTKLARWDKIVEYFRLVEGASDRVRVRELGKSTEGNAFVVLEIAAADTLKRLDYFRGLQRRLYFQDGAPTDAQRDEIFQSGQVRRRSSRATSTRPRSAPRRWCSNWSTGWRPTIRPA